MAGGARVFAIISLARRRLFGPRGVDLARVVALSLVRIRQQVVGGRDLLELLLRVLVARIEVRVQFLGELPVGFADFLRRRGLGDAEDVIGVLQNMGLRSRSTGACLADLPPPAPDSTCERRGRPRARGADRDERKKPPRGTRRLPSGSEIRPCSCPPPVHPRSTDKGSDFSSDCARFAWGDWPAAGTSAVGGRESAETGQAALRLPALDLPVRLSATISKLIF